MKIGLDGRFIRPGQSGNGVFTQLLIEGLADMDNENEYTVYLLENIPFIRKDNFYLKRMPAPHANSHLRFLLTFPLELYRNPVDIFHAIYTIPLLPPKKSVRTVLSLVEFGWFTNPGDFPASPLFKHQIRLMTRQSIQRADRIITPTRFGRNELIKFFNLPAEKVVAIPFGLNERFLKRYNPDYIKRIRKKLEIKKDYILTVGDLHPRKNLVRLIDAFNQLKEIHKIPHQLVIAGKKCFRADKILRKAECSYWRDSIVFTRYVPFKELRALYQGASLLAFPSLDEGFGLPVHEAMASRIPVIVSNRGALPEVAGDAALVVDPLSVEEIADAMLRILESPTLTEKLIKKGLAQIKYFSWDISCRKILRLYKDLCPL